MTTLQEQFERDFPDKGVREIKAGVCEGVFKYRDSNFTNYDLDLREYVNLEKLDLNGSKITSLNLSGLKQLLVLHLNANNLTSVDFLNGLSNAIKLEDLSVHSNNIQPTDISFFSKFVNLWRLKIGTTNFALKEGKRNKFYGSLKAYQNLTKLTSICIEATDVNEGLEYLPASLAQITAKIKKKNRMGYFYIECSPQSTYSKCSQIQNELRPFNYDLEA